MTTQIRHDWRKDEIRALHRLPVLDLIHQAARVHREFHDSTEIQVCKLISIKTGGCPEDCGYCSQAARHQTDVIAEAMMSKDEALALARQAKLNGVSRVCLGAAWREARDNAQFEETLGMVREITALGVEVCCTLGMLTETQAKRLEEAGLHAYNHNLDTSREYYDRVISTRTYDDRLNTIAQVRKTNVTLCTGGIIGLGESVEDRISLLHTLCSMQPHPESVPINILSKVAGTPLAEQPDVDVWETVRMIATARILMPKATVRLSAGRAFLSESDQALCFMAGANSIFSSETGTMLTSAVPTHDYDADAALLHKLGLKPRAPFKEKSLTAEAVR
jgi:biotin synthase